MGQIYHTYFISKAKTDCESVCYQFLCPLPGCNMQAPSLTNMQMHHESKHPKIPWDPSIYTDLQAFPAPLSLTPSPSLPLSPHLPPPSPPRSPSSPGTLEFTPTCWHSFPPPSSPFGLCLPPSAMALLMHSPFFFWCLSNSRSQSTACVSHRRITGQICTCIGICKCVYNTHLQRIRMHGPTGSARGLDPGRGGARHPENRQGQGKDQKGKGKGRR